MSGPPPGWSRQSPPACRAQQALRPLVAGGEKFGFGGGVAAGGGISVAVITGDLMLFHRNTVDEELSFWISRG